MFDSRYHETFKLDNIIKIVYYSTKDCYRAAFLYEFNLEYLFTFHLFLNKIFN